MFRQLVRLFRSHLAPYRRELALVLVFQVLQAGASLYLPSLTADIIDKGIVRGDTAYIWGRGSWMLGMTLLQVGFAIAAVYFGSKAAMGFGRDVRHSLFHTITGYSAREVAGFGAPSLITRVTNDVQQVQMVVHMACTVMLGAPIIVVGGVIMALREDVGLSGLLLVATPVMFLALGILVRRMIPQFEAMQVQIDRVNGVLREQVAGIRVVRAFVREPFERRRFATANDELTATALTSGRLVAYFVPIVTLVVNVSSVAAVWLGGDRIASGQTELGELVAFLSYLLLILSSLLMVTFLVMMAPRAAVSAERIVDVLDTPSTVTDPASGLTELPARGLLELRRVGFHYPGAEEPVVADVSFSVRAGETTAVIGSTGAGKTTLLNLIPRLFDATAGAVCVDGVDVREIDLQTLWSRIGLVPQRPYLFSGTVATNLRYGNADATDDELWEALEIAQARDFVALMPGGLDGRVEQGGTNVSGGQRQRLSIARALVRKPDVYLFDDSFSALDIVTDARLRAALADHTREAAKVIVAQRVSTIVDADQIVVLEDGRLIGLGRHDDLLLSCPTYAEIVDSQLTSGDAR